MSSIIGNTMTSDATQKASKIRTTDLQRRQKIADAGLTASKNLNMKRITEYIVFKAQKEHAAKKHGIIITDLESLKDSLRIKPKLLKRLGKEASVMASEALKSYSQSIAIEKIANAALKASQTLNWKFKKSQKWGNIADTRFESGYYKIRKNWELDGDIYAQTDHTHATFGVTEYDVCYLSYYARDIFNIRVTEGMTLAHEAIAIESLVNTATKSLNELYALQNDGVLLQSKSADEDDENDAQEIPPLDYPIRKKHDATEVGFMKSRNEMSIFVDSEEAQMEIAKVCWYSSSSQINWNRIIKFMEFKARKEYAMETYGVNLGDFESLKEAAFKLFEISEADAAIMASESIADDFESLVVEKIADAAFKSSKILNWVSRGRKWNQKQVPRGILADARFKSSKSLMSYHNKKYVDAYKAYTMETFGVNLVDIEYLKDYAVQVFTCSTLGYMNEEEATIMACQTIAIDKLFEATFKALNSTLQDNRLVEPKQVEDSQDRAMLCFEKDIGLDSLYHFCPLMYHV